MLENKCYNLSIWQKEQWSYKISVCFVRYVRQERSDGSRVYVTGTNPDSYTERYVSKLLEESFSAAITTVKKCSPYSRHSDLRKRTRIFRPPQTVNRLEKYSKKIFCRYNDNNNRIKLNYLVGLVPLFNGNVYASKTKHWELMKIILMIKGLKIILQERCSVLAINFNRI